VKTRGNSRFATKAPNTGACLSSGHSDSRITRKHYAHLLNEDLAAKMRAVMESSV
jgi:hypothetical protein